MGNIKWVKRDFDAALAGMAELTLEQRGAYQTIQDLIYSRDGDVADDERLLCTHLRCRPQTWRRLRTDLMAAGKIRVVATETGPKLRANRTETELKASRNRILKAQFAAEKRWENNGSGHADAFSGAMTPTPTPTEERKRETHSGNGNGKHRVKPRHGSKTKDGKRIWLDRGTSDWNKYAEAYAERHAGMAPPTQWNGSGTWFNLATGDA